jgi:hypothetical protein
MSRPREEGNLPYPKSSGRAAAGKKLERATEPWKVNGVLSKSKGKPGDEENSGPNGGSRTLRGPDGTSGRCLFFWKLEAKVESEKKNLAEPKLVRFPDFAEHGAVTKGMEGSEGWKDNGSLKILRTLPVRVARFVSPIKKQSLAQSDLMGIENRWC